MKDSRRLKELRKKIDSIDLELVRLLNKRSSFVIEVGKVKLREKRDIYSPERELEIYRRLMEKNKGPIPNSALKNIYREIMSASLSLEKPLKIAFLGPYATFTHQASIRHFGFSPEFMPKNEIAEVFDVVERGGADFGVVPVENTAEGAVSHTLDMFIASNLKICAEVLLEVSLLLLNKTGRLEDVKRVASHPHAIGQSTRWLREHLKGIPTIDVASTAASAQMAKEDPAVAAIASEAAANLYDLKVVERNIEDTPHHLTRFLVIGKKEAKKTGTDKTSIVFAIKDTPGALYAMLKPFALRNINLTKIESRPIKTKAWEYLFFVDIDGHITDKKVKDAVRELSLMCLFMKILGSYPKS